MITGFFIVDFEYPIGKAIITIKDNPEKKPAIDLANSFSTST